MAIIYTYPRLNNPDGTELIVVSETKNKNSTRLITLSGICDFCSDEACSNSFKTITTGGDSGISTAIGCDANLNITSSDASVTITTPVDGTVDLKVPIVDPCPTTYVIKPVQCDEETGDCIIIDKQEYWLYSSDCFFAAYAPGYIKDFNVNGNPYSPTGPSSETQFGCYYVEESVFTASASTCEICCDPPEDPVITLTPCGPLAPGSTSTLQSNVSGPAGWESAIDNPCQFAYSSTDFDGWPCVTITLGGVDLGSTVTLDEIKTVDNCLCECCLYPCSYTLDPCEGDMPAVFDPYIGATVSPPVTDPCSFVTGQVVSITVDFQTWCFTLLEVCQDPDYVLPFVGVTDCLDEECTSEPALKHRWIPCSGVGDVIVEATDPGVPVGTVRRYCCEDTELLDLCYQYDGTTEDPLNPAPCPTVIAEDEPGCECCDHPCNYEYTACEGKPEGFDETVVINVGKLKGSCDCDVAPPNIFILNGDDETWCYQEPVRICDGPSADIAGIAECGDPEYCLTGELIRKYRICDGEQWWAEDPADPIDYPGTGIIYAGDLASPPCVFPNCCVEIVTTTEVLDPLGWSIFKAENTCPEEGLTIPDSCDCCKHFDIATYTRCDEECFIEGFPEVNIDVCSWGKSLAVPQDWKPNTAPEYIKINIDGETECCYEKTNTQPCEAETLISVAELAYIDLSFDSGWESCADCQERWFRYENCSTPDELLYTSDILNPGIESLTLPFTGMVNDNTTCENIPGDCCVQIVQEEFEKPLTLTQIDCWDTAYINSSTDCDCCLYQNTHTYVKCDSEFCAIPEEFNSIDIDTCTWFDITQASGTPIPQIIQVEIDGNTCCYNATGEWPCVEPIKVDDITIFEGDPNTCDQCDLELSNFKVTDCATGVVTTTTEDLTAYLGQTWLIDEEECVTVEEYYGPAGPPLGSSFDTQYDQDPPCDCCRYRDVLQYDRCSDVEGEACTGMPATIYVNNTVTAGAVNAIFQETANPTKQCCYVLNETPPCVQDEDSLWTYVIWEETCDELPEICLE